MIDINFDPITAIAELGVSAEMMQYYLIAMVVFVIGGTVLDMMHKKSAKYFFEKAKVSKERAIREVGAGEKVGIAVKTLVEDAALSGEFCNTKRRIAHLLTMYGFILFVATTAIMIFSGSSTLLNQVWHIGAIMLAVGSWWFWLFIRVDVAAEGNKILNISKMDMFSLSLMATSAFALAWSYSNNNMILFILFIVSSTVLFGAVYWSKFAHMFFKPAAAFNKRVTKADGSAENLPVITRDDPEQQKRHSMELLVDAPMNMGLGIKREAPKHY